jgi:hypothetical protein
MLYSPNSILDRLSLGRKDKVAVSVRNVHILLKSYRGAVSILACLFKWYSHKN